MKFKRIKNELNAYYATRTHDQNLNIIKHTETQLALLASEVISIYNILKDSKMERMRNINDTYARWKSRVHNFLDNETSLAKAKKVFPPSRTKTQANFKHQKLTPQSP